MPKFDKNNIDELKVFLRNSCVHDAKLEKIAYKCENDIIKIELFNSIFNVRIDMIFKCIEIFFGIKGNSYGSRETVISLTLEETFTCLNTYFPNYSECFEDSLYLLFQMFSGDEIHIVSEEVLIEIIE